jgi:hypothetical protein
VTFTPTIAAAYDLTDDDFVYSSGTDPVIVTRVSPADAYNDFQVEYSNRAKDYNKAVAEAMDQANVDLYGLRTAGKITADAICASSMALMIAQLQLQRAVYIRNTYQFVLKINKCLLEPMDIVSLTDAVLGFNLLPVRITDIQEQDDFTLQVTAEDFIIGVGTSPTNQIQSANGYQVNQAGDPLNVAAPIIINPPVGITLGKREVWIAVAGSTPSAWGGCEVWISVGGGAYGYVGIINGPARYGSVSASLPDATADPDVTNTLSVDLTASQGSLSSGTMSDADSGLTQCWVGGELISYETATLTATYKYDLTYLRRALNTTDSFAHAIGADFIRLDRGVFRYPYDPVLIGQTLSIKLLSFNQYGKMLQDISTVSPYTVVVGTAPADLTSFMLTIQADGVSARFSWARIRDKMVSHGGAVEIRFFDGPAGSATWAGATFVGSAAGNSTSSGALPYTSGTYLAKTVSADGVYCNNELVIDNYVGSSSGTLTATLMPSFLTGSTHASPLLSGQSVTQNCSITAAGGTTPYGYSWTRTSGSTLISASNPHGKTTPFYFNSNPSSGTTYTATFTCTVTDSASHTVTTAAVTVTIKVT